MRGSIHFLLGAERLERRIDDCDPTMTVLEYLRGVERRPGTKEGCAEGDCGACTVVLGTAGEDGVGYRPVNACIQFLPTLDGAQLLTVEDLADGDTLHPVQRALADQHGSQCGFCTPGMVMSLFAFAHGPHAASPSRAAIDEALAGNLCRCTGYGPIIGAARAVGRPADRFAAEADETRAALAALPDDSVLLEHRGRRFFAPRTADELAAFLLEHPAATILGGGTDVGLWVTKQHRRLETLVWLGRVAELARIEEREGRLVIGAGATYAAARPWLARHWPDLDPLIARIGSTQIRNVGTVGGNIANGSPIGDTPPPLIALGAELVLRRGDTRRTLPLEDFFIAYGRQDRAPGEFVEAVRVPLPDPAERFACYKVSKRFEQDISALLGAYRLRLDGQGRVAMIRIAYGGMAGTPKRAATAEAAMTGAPWNEATVARGMAALAEDFTPLSDMRASADYRMRAARNLLRRFLIETTAPEVETRLQAAGGAA
jgi:xanthine dehydrogenase small subunit